MDLMISGWAFSFWVVLTICLHLIALVLLLGGKGKADLKKLIWLLVILFLPLAGPLLYFILGRRPFRQEAASVSQAHGRG